MQRAFLIKRNRFPNYSNKAETEQIKFLIALVPEFCQRVEDLRVNERFPR